MGNSSSAKEGKAARASASETDESSSVGTGGEDERGRRAKRERRKSEKKRRGGRRRSSLMRARRASSASAGGNASEEDAGAEEAEEKPRVTAWQIVRGGYNDLVHAIIRPPRAEYDISVLGPVEFTVEREVFRREDLELTNKRGLRLVCSHWRPRDDPAPRPCMVYLHGNASCRAEALNSLPLVLSSGMSLFAFDFAGSGNSEGDYISLGWYERDDVETVVEHLRGANLANVIGLWGRSMGAVTALMFGNRDPTIACMILDSPFTSLKQLAKELVDSAQLSVPKFAVGAALRMVRSSVKSRAGFDINKLEPLKNADKCFIPALFGAAEGDSFIRPHHSQEIYDAYAGDKNIVLFEGDHHTPRPPFFHTSVGIWLHNTMVAPCSPNGGSPATITESDLLSNFQNAYSFPSPLRSPPTGGDQGPTSGDRPSEIDFGEDQDGGDTFDPNDYYEQAMLRHAIELSLAEAQSSELGTVREDDTLEENFHDVQRLSESSEFADALAGSATAANAAELPVPAPTPGPGPPPPPPDCPPPPPPAGPPPVVAPAPAPEAAQTCVANEETDVAGRDMTAAEPAEEPAAEPRASEATGAAKGDSRPAAEGAAGQLPVAAAAVATDRAAETAQPVAAPVEAYAVAAPAPASSPSPPLSSAPAAPAPRTVKAQSRSSAPRVRPPAPGQRPMAAAEGGSACGNGPASAAGEVSATAPR